MCAIQEESEVRPLTVLHMKLARSIAFRLFLLIAAVQTIVLLALTYASVRVQQTNLMDNVRLGGIRATDIIARSTRHSMLLNRKDDVQSIIRSLAGEPGIEGVRVYNKLGEVVFATRESDIQTKVDMKAEACVTCHVEGGLEHATPTSAELSRIFVNPDGERVLGLITPIRNEHQCATADCHAHPSSKTILGVLDVKMSLAAVDANLLASRNQLLLLSALSVMAVGIVSGAFIWLFVRRPVKKLIIGMEMVSVGQLDHRLEVRTSDEIGQLATTFNDMTEDLLHARRELMAWSHTLEEKVREKTQDLEKAHKQILRVEKMASLGNLASSVAHELNNPLEGILTFAKLLIKKLQRSSLPSEEIQDYAADLRLIAEESHRSGEIVKNLLVIARHGLPSPQQVRFRTILDRCALLVNHAAKINGVEIRYSCGEEVTIECDLGQIQQLMVALMMNAIEAMAPAPGRPDEGALDIEVRWSERRDALNIRVRDTGQGMSEETKAHIFEPFFTTKSEGKGVGLGLAIAYGIVERHNGSIDVDSTPGIGTTFTVILPAIQPKPGGVDPTHARPEGVEP